MKFRVNERFFDSKACRTYYEGEVYELEGDDLSRLLPMIERHATGLQGNEPPPPPEDDLTGKKRDELEVIAESMGIKVQANDNKATITEKIRAAR